MDFDWWDTGKDELLIGSAAYVDRRIPYPEDVAPVHATLRRDQAGLKIKRGEPQLELAVNGVPRIGGSLPPVRHRPGI